MRCQLRNPDRIFGKPATFEIDLDPSQPLLILTNLAAYPARAVLSRQSLDIFVYTGEDPTRSIRCSLQTNGTVRIPRGDPPVYTWEEFGRLYQNRRLIHMTRVE